MTRKVKIRFINPFQPSVAFHIEISHLIFNENQVTDFYMECNTGLKWVKQFRLICFMEDRFVRKLEYTTVSENGATENRD